jgi:hypothetical protein
MLTKTLLPLLLLCSQFLMAQAADPIVLVATMGKVSYQSATTKAKTPIVDGAVLLRSGTLHLKKESSAWLLQGSNFVQLKGKQRRSVNDALPATPPTAVPLSFDLNFSDYVLSAIYLGATPENGLDGWGEIRTSSKTGDGWGEIRTSSKTGDGWSGIRTSSKTGDGWGGIRTSSKTGDGWGGKGKIILAIHPFGLLLPKLTTLRWSRPAGNPTFNVTIKDAAGQVIHQTTTQDTAWTIDVSQRPFRPRELYHWQVTTSDAAANSEELTFAVADEASYTAALRQIDNSALKAANPATLLLLQAVALERGDFFEEAIACYQQAQTAQPDSELSHLMHAAFWMRYGVPQLASAVWK